MNLNGVELKITQGPNPYAPMCGPIAGVRHDSRTGMAHKARRILDASGYIEDERKPGARQRNDALTVAFARELEDVLKEVFDVDFPELKAPEFLPVRFTPTQEALTFTYRMLGRNGAATAINESGSNVQKVDIEAKEWQQPIITFGASFDFTLFDQMRSGRLGISIDALKAEAARWAVEYYNEQLAAVGDVTQGLVGLVNAPGVAATAQVSTGTWLAQIAAIATATTTNATPPAVVVSQALAADIGAMQNAIFANTLGMREATDCLLPVSLYNLLKVTPQSPGFNSKTLLTFLAETTGLKFSCWPQLNNADTAGTAGVHGMVVVYEKNPRNVNLMMAMAYTQTAPLPVKLAYEVIGFSRGGAAQIRYPLAVTFMKGLG